MRHVSQIQDTIDTCPDEWKWDKTFLNQVFDHKPSVAVSTAMFVATQFTPLTFTGL